MTYYDVLDTIETLLKDKKFNEARNLLDVHIAEEHSEEAHISEIIRLLQSCQQNLKASRPFIGPSDANKIAIEKIQTAKVSIFEVEKKLGELVGKNKLMIRK